MRLDRREHIHHSLLLAPGQSGCQDPPPPAAPPPPPPARKDTTPSPSQQYLWHLILSDGFVGSHSSHLLYCSGLMDPLLLFSVVIKTQTEVGIKFWNLGNVFNTNAFKLVATKKGTTLFSHACNFKEGGGRRGEKEKVQLYCRIPNDTKHDECD